MSSRSNSSIYDKKPLLLFVFCSIFFLIVKAYVVLGPYEQRSVPVEVDDAYVYMLHGEKLTNCTFEKCIGFETLEQQFFEDANWDWGKLKAYHKIVSSKFITYGLLLSGTSKLFNINIESVYFATQIIGLIAGFIAIATLLTKFFSLTISAITLLIISVDVSSATTWMQTFTPSNYALIFIVLFTIFFQKKPKIILKVLYYFLFLLILLIHPMSIVYATILIAMLTYEKKIRSIFLEYFGEIVCIISVFLLYKFYLSINLAPTGFDRLSLDRIFLYNFDSVSNYFLNSFLDTGILIFMSLGLGYIFITRLKYRILILRILFILAITLLFYFHNAPAQLFFRSWDLIAPFIIASALLGLQDINNLKITNFCNKNL